MAIKTGNTVVNIIADITVLLIHVGFIVIVAVNTTKGRVVTWRCMTVGTKFPFPIMIATVNWKILAVVVKSRWDPYGFRMAKRTVS